MFGLLDVAKRQIQSEFARGGYNIGINDGAAAGQTVGHLGHLHIHLILRDPGVVVDPRAGVRWVIPERADCWTGLH